jgi:hypothetical protein
MKPIHVLFGLFAMLYLAGCQTGLVGPLQGPTSQPSDSVFDGGVAVDMPDGGVLVEFDALPRRIGVAKAKDKLTGLALTAEELAEAGTSDGLKKLIDGWMKTNEFEGVMQHWLGEVFQQRGLAAEDIKFTALGLSYYGYIPGYETELRDSFEEMFARTAFGLIQEGRPFTEVATTTRFKLNVPTMSALAFVDANPRADDGARIEADSWIFQKDPNFRVTLTPTVIDPLDSMNIDHPNFMKWTSTGKDCPAGRGELECALYMLYGLERTGPVFTPEDWSWKWVTIRAPSKNESPTYFWDVPRMRAASELVLQTPRVGYFSTPAFLSHWPTAPGNSFRLTTNQTLIVGLDASLTSIAPPTNEVSNGPSDHARPGSPCYGCHQTLDPIRDFFRQNFSTVSMPRPASSQTYGSPIAAEGAFTFGGSTVRGRGIETLGKAIATHPLFAEAWSQKVCVWANAERCEASDPEFQRVVAAFRDSNHDFKTLLREFFASPLSTYGSRTKTSDKHGVIFSVASREQICHRISNRTGRKDVCMLETAFHVYFPGSRFPAYQNAVAIPKTEYLRGESMAVVPREPGILFQPGADSYCSFLSETFVDNVTATSGPVRWGAQELPQSLSEFVTIVMNVPKEDSAYQELFDALKEHYEQTYELTVEQPHNSRRYQALRSTFEMACSSPYAVANQF